MEDSMQTSLEIKKPNGSEPTALQVSSPTPMTMLEIIAQRGASPEEIAKWMELQERWEKNEARKAFVAAMNAFKANPPQILKNKHVKFGQTEYDHATLDQVCRSVTEALSRHGITHRWHVTQQEGLISVTCILTHEQGHSEETTLQGPSDSSGSKNAIQAIASTVTYLQRYTLLAATGLAAGNDDDGSGGMKMGDLAECLEYLDNCRTLDELKKMYGQYYQEAVRLKDQNAKNALTAAKDKKKRELTQ